MSTPSRLEELLRSVDNRSPELPYGLDTPEDEAAVRAISDRLDMRVANLRIEQELHAALRRDVLTNRDLLLNAIPRHRHFCERDISRAFPSASENVARAMLFKLADEGLLDYLSDDMFQVPPLSVAIFVEAYRLRLLLEPPSFIALLGNSEAHLILNKKNSLVRELDGLDPMASFDSDIAFHQTALTLAGNEAESRHVRRYHNLILLWNSAIRGAARRYEVADEHDQILSATCAEEIVSAFIYHFREGTRLSLERTGYTYLIPEFEHLWKISGDVAYRNAERVISARTQS